MTDTNEAKIADPRERAAEHLRLCLDRAATKIGEQAKEKSALKARAEKAEAERDEARRLASIRIQELLADIEEYCLARNRAQDENASLKSALAAYTTGPSEEQVQALYNAVTGVLEVNHTLRANPAHSLWRDAARAVLSCGRPEGGVWIRHFDALVACTNCKALGNNYTGCEDRCSIGLALKKGGE